jgi:zinc transport system substrate-binding protein
VCWALTLLVAVLASRSWAQGTTSGSPEGVGAVAPAPTLAAVAPVRVVVSIPPLRGLVEPLLPPGSSVEVLIPPGVSEHGFEIAPAALAGVAKADLVVYVGLGLEPQLEKFVRERGGKTTGGGGDVVVFATVMGHKDDPGTDHSTHQHDEHGNCIITPGADPHLWLDPVACKSLVREVASRLIALRPLAGVELRDHPIRRAARAQMAALDGLDARFRAVVSAARKGSGPEAAEPTIVVAHDAYRLLGARYGLRTVAIAGLNAGEPKPADLARAIAEVRQRKLIAVFVEPQISPSAARRVAEATGATVLTLDPLGRGDYFATMNQNLLAIAQALGVDASLAAPRTEAKTR